MAVLLPEELDCQYCTDQQKELRGCEEDSSTGYVMGNGEVFHRCPVKNITRDTANYFSMYNNCEKFSTLPFSGALAVQPAKIMQIFSFIQRVSSEKLKSEMEKNAKNRP